MGFRLPGDLSFANSSLSPSVRVQCSFCRDILPGEESCQQPALPFLKAPHADITGPSLQHDLFFTLSAYGPFSKNPLANSPHNVRAHLLSEDMS